MVTASWVVVVLGVTAVLLTALASVLNRRRSRRETSIPLIIDLEALSVSAAAPAPQRGVPAAQTASLSLLAAPLAPGRVVETAGATSRGSLSSSLGLAAALPEAPALQELYAAASPETLAMLSPTDGGGESADQYGDWKPPVGSERPLQRVTPPATLPLTSSTEAPLQLLPGALEIIEGADGPPHIRFFRTAALEVPELTLGRAHGPPYRHIHLRAPSVSRMHARMRFEERCWKIFNLSEVNPIRVNDQVIAATDQGCILGEGDEIYLGEVRLRYRES